MLPREACETYGVPTSLIVEIVDLKAASSEPVLVAGEESNCWVQPVHRFGYMIRRDAVGSHFREEASADCRDLRVRLGAEYRLAF